MTQADPFDKYVPRPKVNTPSWIKYNAFLNDFYTLEIQSPSENGNGTKIPFWGCDYTPQSSSDKVIGSLGIGMLCRIFPQLFHAN